MVYRYIQRVQVEDDDFVTLTISLPDLGSAGAHFIDLPGPDDQSGLNTCNIPLGTGADLKSERTIIFSRPVNVDPDNPEIVADYQINGSSIQVHHNAKTTDISPQIILTIIFISLT